MFKCLDCGAEFGKPAKNTEYRGERFGEKCYEDVFYCPYCDSADYESGTYCRMCGDFYKNHAESNYICNNCAVENYTFDKGIECLQLGGRHLVKTFMNYCFNNIIDELTNALENGSVDEIKLLINGLNNVDFETALKDFHMEEPQEFAVVL